MSVVNLRTHPVRGLPRQHPGWLALIITVAGSGLAAVAWAGYTAGAALA